MGKPTEVPKAKMLRPRIWFKTAVYFGIMYVLQRALAPTGFQQHLDDLGISLRSRIMAIYLPKPNVHIVDLSEIRHPIDEGTEADPFKYVYTDRKALTTLLTEASRTGVSGVAFDIDFSGQPSTGATKRTESEFLGKAWGYNKSMTVALAINERALDDPELWFAPAYATGQDGLPNPKERYPVWQLAGLAGINRADATLGMVYLELKEPSHTLKVPSLGARLVGAKLDGRDSDWISWFASQDVREDNHELGTLSTSIDPSWIGVLRDNVVQADANGHLPPGLSSGYVMAGFVKRPAPHELVEVPGFSGKVPGVLVHGAIAETLVRNKNLRVTPFGTLLVDFILSLILALTIRWTQLEEPKDRQKEAAENKKHRWPEIRHELAWRSLYSILIGLSGVLLLPLLGNFLWDGYLAAVVTIWIEWLLLDIFLPFTGLGPGLKRVLFPKTDVKKVDGSDQETPIA